MTEGVGLRMISELYGWWWVNYLLKSKMDRVVWCDECCEPSMFSCGHSCRGITRREAIEMLLNKLEALNDGGMVLS